MNIPYVMKKCSCCGRWLVASTVNFSRQKGGKYGLESKCKECRSKKNRQYYREHKDEITERKRQYYQEHKDELAEYNRQYCQEHKDELAEYRRQWNKNNSDKVAEYNRQWNKNNSDKVAEYRRQWKEDNLDKVTENRRRYYQKHKDEIVEYNRQWRKDNPDKVAEYSRRQSEKCRQARINAIIAQKRAEYEAERAPLVAEKTCRCCGRTLPASEFYANKKSKDHLQTYCKECHNKKKLERYYHNLETKGWS